MNFDDRDLQRAGGLDGVIAFVAWFDDADQLGQTERFATEVVPLARQALASRT